MPRQLKLPRCLLFFGRLEAGRFHNIGTGILLAIAAGILLAYCNAHLLPYFQGAFSRRVGARVIPRRRNILLANRT